MVWLQPVQLLLHCWQWITTRTTSELLSAWNSFLQSQLRKPRTCVVRIHPLVFHEQMQCIAATKLFRTAVILNGSGPSTNGRALKMYSWAVYKIFWGQSRGFEWTPSNPLPTSLCYISGKLHHSTHLCRVHSHSAQLHKSQHKLTLYICSRKETFHTVWSGYEVTHTQV